MGIFAHLDSVVNTKRGILTKIYRRGPVKGGHTFFLDVFWFGHLHRRTCGQPRHDCMLRAYINDKALADIKYMALFRSETNWLNICPHAICGYMANLTDCGRGEGGG